MSILIKGMKMPKNCYECPFGTVKYYNRSDEFICNITGKMTGLNKCPLIEVPPHGRLIDADALLTNDNPIGKMMVFGGEYVYAQTEIDNAPTIIDAEETNE